MNKKIIIIIGIIIFSTFLLSGCLQVVQISPPSKTKIGKKHVFDKNYIVGQKTTVHVGQPIVKDYDVIHYKSKFMQASDDFVVSKESIKITGYKNTDYIVRGETEVNGKKYIVVNIPGSHFGTGFGLLIDSKGSVQPNALHNDIVMVNTMSSSFAIFNIEPNELQF